MDDSMDPQAFYDESGIQEWERLERNPITRSEFENTVAYLDTELPDRGHVLDAGGGAGRYTVWLAKQGYDVTLIDLSPGQLEVARRQVREQEVASHVTIEQGDIRALPFDEGTFDAVCCLGGPLSHILDADERTLALRELRRVGAEDVPVFVSVMGRLSVIRDHLIRHNPDEMHELWLPLLETGDYTRELVAEVFDDPSWVECHFFRADELRTALENSGLSVNTLVGLEGLLSNLHERVDEIEPETEATLQTLASEYREDPAVVDMSEHILAVSRT